MSDSGDPAVIEQSDSGPQKAAGKMKPPIKQNLFGYDFESLTQEGLVDRIGGFIESGGQHWIATLNVNLICLAERDPSYKKLLQSADIITADGMPIRWVSVLRKKPLLERVTGSDLMLPLAKKAAAKGWRLFFAGGGPGVAEELGKKLTELAPGLIVAGSYCPPLLSYEELVSSNANAEFLDAIDQAKPDVLLLALGSPKQERWIAEQLGKHQAPVSVGVGAAFDFIVGRQTRAPKWMRRTGMEWFYRMARQPGRLIPRYSKDAITFFGLCFREFFSSKP